jgi:hypothetical protein
MRYALMNSRWVAGRLAGWPAHALSWPDDSLLQWPDPDPLSWPDDRWSAGHILALFIGCIAAPCYRPVLQVGRR